MKYYHLLTKEEIQTICRLYPYTEMIEGFKKFSKDFSGISSHRPQKVSEEKGHKLMVDNSQSKLVEKMVESLIGYWISFISENTQKYISDGDSEITAQIKAFQNSPLPGCEALYFKLTEKDASAEFIAVLKEAVSVIKSEKERIASVGNPKSVDSGILERERKDHKSAIKEKEIEIKKKQKENSKLAERVSTLEAESERQQEIANQLRSQIAQLTANATAHKNAERAILNEKGTLEEKLSSASASLQRALSHIASLEQSEKTQRSEIEELQKQIEILKAEANTAQLLLHSENNEILYPTDMEEFSEYFEYNLNSVGIHGASKEGGLLLGYLQDILFQPKPIMCHRATGLTIARCVSNTLFGTLDVPILSWSSQVTSSDIQKYLQADHGVYILDGFIGNYNEQELIPITKTAAGKIIFITFEYEHTIAYMPHEILEYYNYLNLSRIKEFQFGSSPDEDGSNICMEWKKECRTPPNSKYGKICTEIMRQLEFARSVSIHYGQRIENEKTLIQYLAFSILPFAIEAFDCSPYAGSKRLQKYAGDDGKCPYKDLLLRWFGDE